MKNHGEVFTNKREVNAMLDLVKDESYKVNSKFLEPACGNGNFLVEILNRKLETVKTKHAQDYYKYSLVALSNIYGIDIQKDNCEESVERMIEITKNFYDEMKDNSEIEENSDNKSDLYLKNARFILEINIVNGDGLTGMRVDKDSPIVFSEWTFKDNKVYRVDYEMNEMIKAEKQNEANKKMSDKNSGNLFSLTKATQKEVKPKVYKKYEPYNLNEVFE